MSGQLVVVATPIGNLGDLTVRAEQTLRDADLICCEDTRRTRQLLSAKQIPAAGRLIALHEHNEAHVAERVVEVIARGGTVALVSDAGTPGISDPGQRTVNEVLAQGLTVTTTPGPSAAIAALTVSGLASERFAVEGFLPRARGARVTRLKELRDEPRTLVVFESPLRVVDTLREMSEVWGARGAAVVRELTKIHEEIDRGDVGELAERWSNREIKGECVLVIEGAVPRGVDDATVRRAIADELNSGASVRDAASRVSDELGVAHRHAYDVALQIRES